MKIFIESIDHRIAACDGEWWKQGFKTLSLVYAHGRLQDEAGFDLLAVRDEDYPDETTSEITDVTAVLPDGREIPSRMYRWYVPSKFSPHQTGLLVAINDTRAEAYAKARYEARRDFP